MCPRVVLIVNINGSSVPCGLVGMYIHHNLLLPITSARTFNLGPRLGQL